MPSHLWETMAGLPYIGFPFLLETVENLLNIYPSPSPWERARVWVISHPFCSYANRINPTSSSVISSTELNPTL